MKKTVVCWGDMVSYFESPAFAGIIERIVLNNPQLLERLKDKINGIEAGGSGGGGKTCRHSDKIIECP